MASEIEYGRGAGVLSSLCLLRQVLTELVSAYAELDLDDGSSGDPRCTVGR